MKLYDFTIPELKRFEELCNFTPDELQYFWLRAKYKSNIEIAMTMNVSDAQVSKLARRVKDKIIRIL